VVLLRKGSAGATENSPLGRGGGGADGVVRREAPGVAAEPTGWLGAKRRGGHLRQIPRGFGVG